MRWSRKAVLLCLVLACCTSSFSAQAESEASEYADGEEQLTTGAGLEARQTEEQRPQDRGNQHEPVPDAQHQVAMQQAEQSALNDQAAGRSPTVRVNLATTAPVAAIRSTTPGAVFLMTVAMASCSGLGAAPFFFVGALSKQWAALANAVACGVMLAASFDLLHEGQPYGAGFVIFGLISGALFINATQNKLQQYEDVKFEGLKGANARKLVLVVGIMAAHALGEGSGVGVSFCGSRGWAQGLLVTLAIGLHNIPEGLAVATVLVAKGISARHAFWWTIFTSMPQPLLALPSFVFVDTFRALLPIALGFAAGCMLWMVFAELLPDALEDSKAGKVATAATFSAAWLEALRMMLAGLENPQGGMALPLGENFGAGLRTGTILVLGTSAAASFTGSVACSMTLPGPVTMGAAAAGLVWVGGAGLVHQLVFQSHAHLIETLLAAGVGAVGAVFAHRWLMGQLTVAAVDGKRDEESQGKLANGTVGHWDGSNAGGGAQPSPLILPVTNGDAGALASDHGSPHAKKVFMAKRSMQAGPSAMRGASAGLAMLALAAHGVPDGWSLAELTGYDPAEATRILPPTMLRVVVIAAASSFLAGHVLPRPSVPLQTTVAVLVACVMPISAAVDIFRGAGPTEEGLGGHAHWVCHLEAAMTGMCLMVGVGQVLACAQRMRLRASQAGFALGLFVCAALYCVMQMLCWSTVYCTSSLTA